MGPVEVVWNGDRVPHWKGHGTSVSIMGWRYYMMEMGYTPPLPTGGGGQSENITFLHPADAGGNKGTQYHRCSIVYQPPLVSGILLKLTGPAPLT